MSSTQPVLGRPATVSVTQGTANAFLVLALDVGPPSFFSFGACTLHVNPLTAVTSIVGMTSGSGAWSTQLPVPGRESFAGVQITLQTFLINAGGPFLGVGDLSNSLMLTLGF